MDQSQIRRLLCDSYSVVYYEDLPSTNDRALELARAGAPHGTVVVAEYQTAGRGRRGAQWSAPAGSSVLASLVLRPEKQLSPHVLAIYSGATVASALDILGIPAKVKWPNDIMVEDRKVAGILIETTGDAVVIGIGINHDIPDDDFPPDLHYPAGSLTQLGYPTNIELIFAKVINELQTNLPLAYEERSLKLLLLWNKFNWMKRKKVRVCGHMGVVEGDGVFLSGNDMKFHIFRDGGVVPMPLTSKIEVI